MYNEVRQRASSHWQQEDCQRWEVCGNEADAYLKKENREKHEACGAMW